VFKNGAKLLAAYHHYYHHHHHHHHNTIRVVSVLINANPDDTSIPAESPVFMSSDLPFASARGPLAVVGITIGYIYTSRLLIYVALNVIASLDTPVKNTLYHHVTNTRF
jgi:hypothetical protein